ncbi:MAG TPA: hypothetical protein VNJ08_13650 [Bacteriovoracaceae bacterium]|nr:hypothetical protein [Bacteriovoracaceae bacterium]
MNMPIYTMLLLTLPLLANAMEMPNPFSKEGYLKQLGMTRDLVVDINGKKTIVMTFRDGSKSIYVNQVHESSVDDFSIDGKIVRIEQSDLKGTTNIYYDNDQRLSTKSVYSLDKGVDTIKRYFWTGEAWKESSIESGNYMTAGDCDHGPAKDSLPVGVLTNGYEALVRYTQGNGDNFKLNVVDCGLYGDAENPTEGTQKVKDDFGEAMKLGAQCMMKLAHDAPKGSPQAKFMSQMTGQFGWIFERKQTIKCGIDDTNVRKPPFDKHIRAKDAKQPDPPDQSFTIMTKLRPDKITFRKDGTIDVNTGKAVRHASEREDLMNVDEIPGIALNIAAHTGPGGMKPKHRITSIFHEFLHIAGITHEESSTGSDLVKHMEACCMDHSSLACQAILEGKTIVGGKITEKPMGGVCSWGPNGKCFAN